MSFDGARVLSLESRRAIEIATLIRNQGGDPFVAPSMRESAIEQNEPLFAFAQRFLGGEFEMLILLTGVGFRALRTKILERYADDLLMAALRAVTIVARGPKPSAALRALGLTADILVPEPNTWRELLQATEHCTERRIAVQEYGRPNMDLLQALRARGAEVTAVRVYEWALPEDMGPLREAVRRLACGEFEVAMFTTSIQVVHLLELAAAEGVETAVREQLRDHVVVASIGPSCTETLEDHGIPVDYAPSHPKMGFLVTETAARAAGLRAAKSVREAR